MNRTFKILRHLLLLLALLPAGAKTSLAQSEGEFLVAKGSGDVYRILRRLGNGGMGVAFLVEAKTETGVKQQVLKVFFAKYDKLAERAHVAAKGFEANPHLAPISAVDDFASQTSTNLNPAQLEAIAQLKAVHANDATTPFANGSNSSPPKNLSTIGVIMPLYEGSADAAFKPLYDPKRGTAAERLAERAVLAEQFIHDVSEALAAMDKSGMTHNDLKPENVFFETLNGKIRFVLADFDMVRPIGKLEASGSGSYGFIAPERFKPKHQNDIAADFYSLGVSALSLLSDDTDWLEKLKDSSREFRFSRFREIITSQLELIRKSAKGTTAKDTIDRLLTFIDAATVDNPEARRQALQGLGKTYPPASRLSAKPEGCRITRATTDFLTSPVP